MSLLSIDISKVKRLSLKEVKLTAPETEEDSFLLIAFNKWVKANPEGGVFRYKGKTFKIIPKK